MVSRFENRQTSPGVVVASENGIDHFLAGANGLREISAGTIVENSIPPLDDIRSRKTPLRRREAASENHCARRP
jgi:hypothetical protein